MIALMEYEWDESKNAINIVKHGVEFSLINGFDWSSALIVVDKLHGDSEQRFTAVGFIGDRLYVCIYTCRGEKRRIISLRKANLRERKSYEQEA
jgi:uncharacterized DUF497 family protein